MRFRLGLGFGLGFGIGVWGLDQGLPCHSLYIMNYTKLLYLASMRKVSNKDLKDILPETIYQKAINSIEDEVNKVEHKLDLMK